jgi:hypothetical protein
MLQPSHSELVKGWITRELRQASTMLIGVNLEDEHADALVVELEELIAHVTSCRKNPKPPA